MRSIEVYKRQLRRLIGEQAGQNLDFSRPWVSQQVSADLLGEILALPVDPDSVIDLNTADGSLVFVPGISDPGGTDVIV